jgi:uncharacterized membrane protein
MSVIKSFRPAIFSVSATVHQWLLASACFSGLLLLIRMLVTQTIEYIFLPWNLFLAFVPYRITWWMTRNVAVMENKIKLLGALAAWLLFIPNSFYIITDLFHLIHVRTAPKWFDLLLIFSFAWNGIVCGIISLRRVELLAGLLKGRRFSFFLVLVVMWLSAFGIYIGRFLRFNSWDVITDPFSLLAEITSMVIHPFENGYAWGMTICYAVFMTLLYFTVKKLGESFVLVK